MVTTTQTTDVKKASVATEGLLPRKVKPMIRKSSATKSKARKETSKQGRTAANLLSKGSKVASEAYDWVGEKASNLPKFAPPIGRQNLNAVNKMMRDNPVVIGVLGLGIGVVLGALLPSSDGRATRH